MLFPNGISPMIHFVLSLVCLGIHTAKCFYHRVLHSFFSLQSDCLGGPFDLSRISQIIILNRFQTLIQFVDQGNSRGNIYVHNISIRYIIDVLDKRPNAVSMGG